MSDLTLIVNSSSGAGELRFPVTSSHVTIGSGESCSLVIEDEGLARLHASIYVEDDGTAWVVDERRAASGAVYVNDTLVPAAGRALRNGDQIYLGEGTTIRVSISARAPRHSSAAVTESAPAKGTKKQTHSRWSVVAAVVCAACLLGIVALGVKSWSRRTQARAQGQEKDSARLQEGATPSPTAAPTTTPPESATPAPLATSAPSEAPAPPAPAGGRRLYMDIKDPRERAEYVEQKAQHIARMMSNREYAFNREVVLIIQGYVDAYASRARSKSTKLWGEGLTTLYGRATRFAPTIIRAFDARGVPPVVGLYIVMIETEYHTCLESPVGAKGLFQFMPDTAREYHVDPADRCDVERMAPAAAHYVSRRIGEFGTDPMSVALGIAAYNRGPDSVRRDLSDVVNSGNSERSFWTLVANADKLDHYFQRENAKYVPKFFAAAIVGEHPWDFGLDIRPLSTYTSPPAAPGAQPEMRP